MKLMRSLKVAAFFCFSAAVLLSGSATAAAQTKKQQKEAKTLAEQASKAFDQKNFRLAVDQYAQSLALVPNNPEAHYKKGVAHLNLKEDAQALTEFQQALSQGYNRPLDIYSVRWKIFRDQKNTDAALADLQQAATLDPQNPQLQLAAGDLALVRGENDKALDAYQKASLRIPNNPEPFLGIARAKYALGDAAGQLEAAENALKHGTQQYAEANFLMADALQKLNRPDDAIEAYKKVITADTGRFEVYKTMGALYRSQGRFDDAIDILRKGLTAVNLRIEELTKDPATPPDAVKNMRVLAAAMYTDASWLYSFEDRPDDAVQAALAALRLQPDQAAAYTNLCRAYNDLKKPEMAVTACYNALKSDPSDGETLFYLGRAYDLAGRRPDANRAYKGAVSGLIGLTQKNPVSSDGFYLLGNAYFADNQPQKAIEAYQKSLELSPRFARARFNLGYILNSQKQKQAALEQYNSLLQLDPALAAKLKAEIDKPQ